jgi:hypothetical protein
MKKLSFFLCLFFIFSGLSFASNSSPAFTIRKNPQTAFNYEITKGSTIIDYFEIVNLDPERWIEISLSLSNTFPKRIIRIDKNKIRLQPLESQKIRIIISIPVQFDEDHIKGNIILSTQQYENKEKNPGLQINLGIASTANIKIIEGPKKSKDYTEGILFSTKNQTNIQTEKTYKVIKRLNIKGTISNLFIVIENNISIVLLLIIIALILKIVLQEHLNKTKTESKNVVSHPKKISKTKAKTTKKSKK